MPRNNEDFHVGTYIHTPKGVNPLGSFNVGSFNQNKEGASVEVLGPLSPQTNPSVDTSNDWFYKRRPDYLEKAQKRFDDLTDRLHPEDLIKDSSGNVVGRQDSLFVVPPPTLLAAASSKPYLPESKNAIATAIAESKRKWGVAPTFSTTLSQDSEPVVRQLTEAGLLRKTAETDPDEIRRFSKGFDLGGKFRREVVRGARQRAFQKRINRLPQEQVNADVSAFEEALANRRAAKRQGRSQQFNTVDPNQLELPFGDTNA